MSEPTKLLVNFNWDCGRGGYVDGLFVTTQDELQAAYGKSVQFGEILGKHSDIHGTLDPQDITVITEDQAFIEKLIDLIGADVSGYNPLSYMGDDEEE